MPPGRTEKQFNLRLSDELMAAVDGGVDAHNKANPLLKINRSDFIRQALVQFIQNAAPAKSASKKASR